MNREPLNRSDWLLIAICVAITAASLFVALNWFGAAFPEASIDFRYDRKASRAIAERLLAAQRIDVRDMKHTAVFDGDDYGKIFLERSVGLARANAVMRRDVRLWWWRNRWFRPLQEEEFQVDVAPTGEIVSFTDVIPESRALPAVDLPRARQLATSFLTLNSVRIPDLQLVSESERQLPHRVQRIFTWESQSIRPAGAPYRHVITVDGDRVSSYAQKLRVPETWQRQYRELRSKNMLAGNVDLIFMAITMIAIVAIFIVRLLRGDVRVRMVLVIAVVSIILVTGVSLNSFPIALAGYNTTSSYPAFLAQTIFSALMQGLGVGMLLVVIVGTGEVLYRERLPGQLAIPRLWSKRVFTSKRVFLSFVIGYALVAFFLAYQVVFYLVAERFGAWSPAEIPYDEMLNTAFPWIAVLFAGFFPSLSEEFLSRAFSIPFFEKILRSRVAAIVLAGFVWGFGHATYPNQPFYIRGVEVGIAGVVIGFLLYRFGILPLLIWHYTVDALYTALLLLRSGNRYYMISSGLASLVFAIPMIVSIVLYIRNRGFVADDDLLNATIPLKPVPPPREEEVPAVQDLATIEPASRRRLPAFIALIVIAAVVIAARPTALSDVMDYRISGAEAKRIAATWTKPFATTLAAPVEGFRAWDRGSSREDGGGATGFDDIASTYLLRHGVSVKQLVELMKTKFPSATWMIRSYTAEQREETFTEVDPRTAKVVGFHRYQDEKKKGARLDQNAALIIASREFARYGLQVGEFEMKEALAFQQPERRDWLFHFQERTPVAANAFRRVTARVAGSEVTQFTPNIKIPDDVYRDAARQTVGSVVINLVRIVAVFLVLGLIIAGFVTGARKNGFRWRRALRWTAVLSIIPIGAALLRWPLRMFEYDTSMQWNTFIVNQSITIVRGAALQIGFIFLAMVAIDILHPEAFDLLRRGRGRVGRAAVAAALAAIALFAVRRGLLHMLVTAFPSVAAIDGFDVPDLVALPLPAFLIIGDAILRGIEISAALALFVHALKGFEGPAWLPDVIGSVAMFCLTLDASVRPSEMPFALLVSTTIALVLWISVRFILGRNLLAYPVAAALLFLGGGAATLLQNHRPDLLVNGLVTVAAAAALMLWLSLPSRGPAVT